MSVRAKFRCNSLKEEIGSPNTFNVGLTPVGYSDKNEENKRFFQATPGGEINLNVVAEDTARTFKPGKHYYVDFTPAED